MCSLARDESEKGGGEEEGEVFREMCIWKQVLEDAIR